MLSLNKPKRDARESAKPSVGKVQMNMQVTPAFKRKLKRRAIDLDMYPCNLIEMVMTDYLDRSEESEKIARK